MCTSMHICMHLVTYMCTSHERRTHVCSAYSTVELGLNLKVICIKLQVIPSDRKFSRLFNGITCHFVSVGEKML